MGKQSVRVKSSTRKLKGCRWLTVAALATVLASCSGDSDKPEDGPSASRDATTSQSENQAGESRLGSADPITETGALAAASASELNATVKQINGQVEDLNTKLQVFSNWPEIELPENSSIFIFESSITPGDRVDTNRPKSQLSRDDGPTRRTRLKYSTTATAESLNDFYREQFAGMAQWETSNRVDNNLNFVDSDGNSFRTSVRPDFMLDENNEPFEIQNVDLTLIEKISAVEADSLIYLAWAGKHPMPDIGIRTATISSSSTAGVDAGDNVANNPSVLFTISQRDSERSMTLEQLKDQVESSAAESDYSVQTKAEVSAFERLGKTELSHPTFENTYVSYDETLAEANLTVIFRN